MGPGSESFVGKVAFGREAQIDIVAAGHAGGLWLFP